MQLAAVVQVALGWQMVAGLQVTVDLWEALDWKKVVDLQLAAVVQVALGWKMVAVLQVTVDL